MLRHFRGATFQMSESLVPNQNYFCWFIEKFLVVAPYIKCWLSYELKNIDSTKIGCQSLGCPIYKILAFIRFKILAFKNRLSVPLRAFSFFHSCWMGGPRGGCNNQPLGFQLSAVPIKYQSSEQAQKWFVFVVSHSSRIGTEACNVNQTLLEQRALHLRGQTSSYCLSLAVRKCVQCQYCCFWEGGFHSLLLHCSHLLEVARKHRFDQSQTVTMQMLWHFLLRVMRPIAYLAVVPAVAA